MKRTVSILLALLILSSGLLIGCENNTKLPSEPDPIDDNYRVVYQIFVGSFSDSNGDGTGDLQGIINRMDYLNDGDINNGNDLGVQLLWLSPIFSSPTYHKYDTIDYYKIDEKFGTEETLKELLNLCHERNVKVILDIALNHTSNSNVWFQKFLGAHNNKNTESEYYNWYSWATDDNRPAGRKFAKLGTSGHYYECNFDTGMPELNYDLPEVRQAVFDVCKYYLNLGVDGFRFDAVKYIYYGDVAKNLEYWSELISQLKEVKPDAYFVGEVWSGNSEIVQYYGALNCFDFAMAGSDGMIAAAANGKSGQIDNYTKYVCSFQNMVSGKREDVIYQPFIANHDMDRAAGFITVSSGGAFMAANLLLLSPGSPVIYYGEEIGMKGSRGASNTDANRRLAMLWGDDDTVRDPTGSTFDSSKQINGTVQDQLKNEKSLLNYYAKLIAVRRKYPAIARGTYVQIDLSSQFVGGFEIRYGDESLGLIHNTTNFESTVDLSEYTGCTFTELVEIIGLGSASLEGTILTIGANTSVILR